MAIENLHREEQVTGSSDRVFGLVFAVFFTVIGCWPLFMGAAVRLWALGIAAVFLVLALIWPASLSGLNRWWMKFGVLIGKVVSPIALGLVFYLTILPIGLILRLSGKDLLRLKMDRAANTYWIPREPPGPDPRTLNNQF